jgi:hypothetical protein
VGPQVGVEPHVLEEAGLATNVSDLWEGEEEFGAEGRRRHGVIF